MHKLLLRVWIPLLTAALTLLMPPSAVAQATAGLQGRLASVAWLKQNLARADLLILDASPAPMHRQQHIPGSVNADMLLFGAQDVPLAEIEQRMRGWGIGPELQIVIVDPGGTYMATRLFWDLLQYGLPTERLFVLDGGMAKWLAEGGPVTKDATPAPRPGTVRVTALDAGVRVRLPEFLAATADPRANVMLEALDPPYYYGGAAFFNRGGHVPHATLMPADDFYNADKTFKSPAEIARMLGHLGIRPEQEVLTYCGGGGAAAVPFFALKYLVGYPKVRMFQESQLGWLQDERELPLWTYAEPHLVRDTAWLKAWGSPMLKAFGLSKLSIVDVRPAEAFQLGHVPLAVNVPAQEFRRHADSPERLAALLGQAGVDRAHEAVLVSEGGLNEAAALAFVMLERLGQHKVSIFTDSVERWAELGQQVARPAAAAGKPASPTRPYSMDLRVDTLVTAGSGSAGAPGAFPKVYIASGAERPARSPAPADGRVLHVPYTQLLNTDGTPKAAKEIWKTLAQAGVPRYAEIVTFADATGEAAINYVILRLMGFADVKVWVP